jgi:hypothetical protein
MARNLRNIEITQDDAAKVLSVIDAGLVSGIGEADKNGRGIPGRICVEAAVCEALGLPHSDDPQCVSRAVRALKIRLNDQNWSSPMSRAKGLRRLGIAQLGSRDTIDDRAFAKRVAELAIRKMVPIALRAAASIQKDATHRQKLLDAANRCEAEGTRAAASAAYAAARAAEAAARAARAAARTAARAANAYAANAYAAYAAARAAEAAAYAAEAAAYAARAAAYAANAEAASAAARTAEAAAYAAEAAAYAAEAAKRDEIMSDFAEGVVQILVEMNAPGCQFLNLTEVAA